MWSIEWFASKKSYSRKVITEKKKKTKKKTGVGKEKWVKNRLNAQIFIERAESK